MKLILQNIRNLLLRVSMLLMVSLLAQYTYAAFTISVDYDTVCNGATNGELIVYAVGGTGDYTYEIYDLPFTGFFQSVGPTAVDSAVFSSLTPKRYLIIVSNTDGSLDESAVADVIEDPILSAGTISVDNPLSCFNSSDLELRANPTGGTGNYTYLWHNGAAEGQTGQVATGLDGSQAFYSVDVTDSRGCGPFSTNAFRGIDYVVPPTITISSVTTTETCEATQNGTITITASGGTAPLTYSIVKVSNSDSTFQAANTFTGLGSGFYTPWVTDNNGCNLADANVLVDSAAQPTAPVLTKDPNAAIVCAGTTLTVDTVSGTGGSGTVEDQFRFSTDNGATWSAWSTTISSFAAITGTNLIESRRTSTGAGCITSPSNQVSWTVVDQPVAPGITRNPDVDSVCEGQILTVVTTPGTGGTGTITDEYRFSTDNGATWSAWSTTVPNFAAIAGTNLIESRRTADGTGCNTSPSNQVSWTVEPQPVAPGITKNPNVADVCAGQILTVTTTPGSGGAGTIEDQYRYSTDNGATWTGWSTTVPSFAAVIGTNLIESRRFASGSNCTTSPSNQVSWIVVAQPVAPGITKNPNVAVACEGQLLSVTVVPGTGGAGVTADEYRFSTDNGATWSAWSTTVPNFAAVVGTNLIESRRTATGTGCVTSASNQVSWTVVDQPTAPGLTRNPDVNDVCEGTLLTVTVTPGTGGSGTITDEYRFSTDNGATWSAWSTTVPNFAAITGTNLIESRRTATGSGCTTSPSNQVSWNVVAQPVAPGITKSPADATVCSGTTLTVTITPGTGGAGTTADEYRFSTDNGATWSAWSTTTPSFAAVTGTNLIESRRTADGTGCSTSASNQVSWTVVDQPVAPGLTKSPDVPEVCEGQILTVVTTPGTGGTGTIADEYRFSTDNGATWSAWNTAVPNFAAVVGTNLIESRRTADGTGCSTSPSNQVSWTVTAQPVAPGLTKNPDVPEVCEGTTLTVITTPGTGGGGTTADEYRFSTDNGATWSAWSTTTPSFAAVIGTNLIESRRTATGTGCTTSASNQVSWIVVAQPVAPGITKNPNVAEVCETTLLTVTVVPGTGGAGTTADEYRFSTDNGATWSAWSTTVPNFAAVTGTNLIESRRTADGPGCSTSASNQVSWTVVDQPVAPGLTRNPNENDVCVGQLLTVTVTPGSGGSGTIADEYRFSTDNGTTWSVWSTTVPNFAAVLGVNLVESRRTATGSGCTTSPSNQVTWNVVTQPVAPVIAKDPTDATVCEGQTLTITITTPGSGGAGTTEDQYRFSTDNGATWSAWSTTIPSFAGVIGTNLVESRRTSSSTGCSTSPSNQVSWNVVAQPVAPGITRNPDVDDVCEGQLLTVITTPGTGGTGTIADEYRFSTDNGTTWSAWSTTVPNFVAVIGTNLIESRRTADGTGCSVSPSNQVSWNVAAQPTAPALTKDPDVADVCEGSTLTITITPGTGGIGTTADEYRFSTDNGATWSAWNTTIPSFAAVIGTNLVESRRTATGTGCTTSPSNQVSWNVVAQPVAPVIAKNPADASLCEGVNLSITVVTPGTGGAGTTADEYRFSTDNGATWSTWSTTIPSFAAIVGTNLIESRRTADGTGCTTSPSNQVSWIVEALPVAPGITRNPDQNDVCAGDILTVITIPGSGGSGTVADEYRFSTDNGATWSAWSTTIPSFAAVIGTNLVESRRTATGTGCTTSPSNQVSWTVNQNPVANAGFDADACGLDHMLFAIPSIGTGTWSQFSGPGTVVSWNPDEFTAMTTVTVDTYGTYEFEWIENNNGCIDSDIVEVTFNRQPEAEAGSNGAICNDSTYTIFDADTNYATNVVWVTSGTGTFSPSEFVINPIYIPSQADRDSGYVWLYLQANGHPSCALTPGLDSMRLDIAPLLDVSIGAPMPFPIGPNTKVEVRVKTGYNHFPNQDLSYHLVAPDGQTRVVLKESPNKWANLGPGTICNLGFDVDLTFTTDKPLNDTLVICTGGPDLGLYIEDTVNATGAWDSIYGFNPAQGGWTIEIYDYILGGIEGAVTDYHISFIDTNTVTGLLEEVRFESANDSVPINNGPGWPAYGLTRLQAPTELVTSCAGACDASAIVNVIGGNPPYVTFDWTPAPAGGNGRDSVQFCAGTYYLTVTDDIGCQGFDSVVVVDPPQIVVDTIYFTDPLSCNADTNGTITVKASRGGSPVGLTYVLLQTNDTIASNDSAHFVNVSAGVYTVEVHDAYGCFIDTTITITEPAPVAVDTAYILKSLACSGDADGEIRAKAAGGNSPYTFRLIEHPLRDTVSTVVHTDSATFTGLTLGNYTVEITDVNSCGPDISDTLIITSPNPILFDTILAIDTLLCFTDTAAVTVVATGGTGFLTVRAINGTDTTVADTIVNDTAIVNGFPGRNYILLEDDAGCQLIDSVDIAGPPAELKFDNIVITDIPPTGCWDDKTGAIEVFVSGGWGNYVYDYTLMGTTIRTGDSLGALGQGDYTIDVYDRNGAGCVITTTVTINGPSEIQVSPSVVNVVVDTLGSVTLSASGGTPPYTYWLSDTYVHDTLRTYQASNFFDSLDIGVYHYAVKDANGCIKEGQVTVSEDRLDVGIEFTCDFTDPSLAFSVFEGTAPYTVVDTNLSTGEIQTIIRSTSFFTVSVDTGWHSVWVYDQNLNYDTTIYVSYPVIQGITTNYKTCADPLLGLDSLPTWDGSLEITTFGGTGDYFYQIEALNELTLDTVIVTQTISSENLIVIEGLGEYTYHQVYVQDEEGCTDFWNFSEVDSVGARTNFERGLIDDTTVCKYNKLDLNAGFIFPGRWPDQRWEVDATWEPEEIIISSNGNPTLPAATAYITDSVNIKLKLLQTSKDPNDPQYCIALDSIQVNIFPPVDGTFALENSPGYGYDSLTGSILATAGASITINLDSNYRHTDMLDELPVELEKGMLVPLADFPPNPPHQHVIFAEGDFFEIYSLQVTDSGCSETDTIFIGVRPEIVNDSIYTMFSPNGDGINDTWTIPYAHLYSDVEVEIFNRWGQMVYRRSGYGASTDYEWDGKSMQNGNDLPIGTYFYVIKPNDGQTQPITGTVTILR